MEKIHASVETLKEKLTFLRKRSKDVLPGLTAWYDHAMTWSSTAIEGNTLTRQESVTLIEKGITVGGKTLREHLEIMDHHEAIHEMHRLVHQNQPVTENDILFIHKLVMARTCTDAGQYAKIPRRIAGSFAVLPSPHKIPQLMKSFVADLGPSSNCMSAVEAHYDLVAIHPFRDGNGRTARLLMNTMLLQGGYSPILINPEHRGDYIRVIEARNLKEPIGHNQVDRSTRDEYQSFMLKRLKESLEDQIAFLEQRSGRRGSKEPEKE